MSGSLVPRRFTVDERDLLQLAAGRAAVAIQHAALYEQERSARRAAEAAAPAVGVAAAGGGCGVGVSVGGGAAAGAAGADHGDPGHRHGGDPVARRDGAGVAGAGGEGDRGGGRAGGADPGRQGVRGADRGGAAADRDRRCRSCRHPESDPAREGDPVVAGGAVAGGGSGAGGVACRQPGAAAVHVDERDLLQLAAGRAAVAIQHAALYEQRRLADALQRRLLPDLRRVAGLELAGRYLPASGASLGGDWYDAFPLAGGRIAVATGDVVGHGVDAAAVMAQLRTALRAYAVDGARPAAVVERVNALIQDLGPPDDDDARLRRHRSRARVARGRDRRAPAAAADPARAARRSSCRCRAASRWARRRSRATAATRTPSRPGTTIVLYTDGLVETRGESIDDGLERLAALAAGSARPRGAVHAARSTRWCPASPRTTSSSSSRAVPPLPERLHGRWPADAQRARLRAAAPAPLAAGAGGDGRRDRRHHRGLPGGVHERGRARLRPGRPVVRLEATCHDGAVRITVRDEGPGGRRAAPTAGAGS